MYEWLVLIHLVGLGLFLVTHAVSMWVAFRIRGEPDRNVIAAMLGMSQRGSQTMYLGLLLLAIGGFGAAAQAGLLTVGWMVASYVTLVIVMLAMWAIGAGFYYPLRAEITGTDEVARLEDAELAARLQNRRPEALTIVGGVGLVILTWLMTVKPF